ncbi:hypothetical protein [Streptosporangium sp. NPDC049376]|uniref:hypothetical protein n=1 Tax=Streptosporangium sp. NPDC049376 TaxID=3366192 RepID=UPI00379A104F
MVVVRFTATTDGSPLWVSGDTIPGFLLSENALLLVTTSGGLSVPSFNVSAGDGWILYAATKASGSAIPRYHKYVYSTGVWSHSDGDSTVLDGAAAGGSAVVNLGLDMSGDLAAAAIIRRILSDSEIENLAHSLNAWISAAPSAMWVLDQSTTGQTVADWTGRGSNQTTLTGSSVAASSAPIGYGAQVIDTIPKRTIPANVTPGVLSAPWTLPAPAISAGRTVAPSVVSAPWVLPAPEVFTIGDLPTLVEPNPVVATATVPAPTVQAFKNVNLTPAPVAATATVPTPLVSVPVNPGDDLTGPGQLSFNGYRIGGGTYIGLDTLDGADIALPGVDNGNVPNPNAHGSLPGRKLSQARIITFTGKLKAPRDMVQEVAEGLRDATPILEGDEEWPLAIQVLGTIYVGDGAVIRRHVDINQRYRLGFAPVILQWELSDPRLYSRQLVSAVIADGTVQSLANAGNAPTRPLIRIPGPSDRPLLTADRLDNLGQIAETRVLEFDLQVEAGETLIIDVKRGTAAIGDDSKMKFLTGASLSVPDFTLSRGFTDVSYQTVPGGAPPATVLWRHAHI